MWATARCKAMRPYPRASDPARFRLQPVIDPPKAERKWIAIK